MFKLEFKTDNAAFDGADLYGEIAWVLEKVVSRLDYGLSGAPSGSMIRDSNGNIIGTWEYTP